MVYIISILAATIILKMAYVYENNRWVRNICIAMSGLILVLLAAFRDECVGTDVLIYQKRFYLIALKYDSLFRYLEATNYVDPAYMAITYFASKLGSLFWVFFFNESILVIFLFYIVWQYRKIIYPHEALACYLFFYYCLGLCVIRQCISILIIMSAMLFYKQKKYVTVAILSVLAFTFHQSAIVCVVVYTAYYCSQSNLRKIYSFLIFSAVIILVVYFQRIVFFAYKVFPFIPRKYVVAYLYKSYGYDMNSSMTIVLLLSLLIIFGVIKQNKAIEGINYRFLIYMVWLALAGIFVGRYSPQLQRSFWVCQTYIIFIFPQVFRLIKRNAVNILSTKCFFYAFLIFYMAFSYIYKTVYGVYPYVLSNGIVLY